MATEGQHRARLVVAGDAKSANRELGEMARQQTRLERELAKANAALAKQGAALTNVENKARSATAAEQRLAQQKSSVLENASLQSRVTAAAQERELIHATTKLDQEGVQKRISAIERHRDAQLQAIHARRASAEGEHQFLKTFDDERAVMHRASIDRIQLEGRFREQEAQREAQRVAQQKAQGQQRMQAIAGGALAAVAAITTATVVVDKGAQRLDAFRNVALNLPFSIEKASKAAHNSIPDFTLMRLAVQANRLGVAKSAESFAELADMAVVLGKSVGRDPVDALERLTMGIGKQEQEILDELGIVVRASEAHKVWAKAHHTTVAAMSDLEKQQAFTSLALQRGSAVAKNAKVDIDNVGSAWERFKVKTVNAADAVLVAIDDSWPAISAYADFASGGMFGSSLAEQHLDDVSDAVARNQSALEKNLTAIRDWRVANEQAISPTSKLTKAIRDLGDSITTLEIEAGTHELSKLTRDLQKGLDDVNKAATDATGFERLKALTELDYGAQVHELDKQLAYLKSVKGEEEQIEMLTQRRVALLMEEAALVGDTAKATEIRRAEEIRLAGGGGGGRRRGGGGRNRARDAKEAQLEADIAAERRAAQEIIAIEESTLAERLEAIEREAAAERALLDFKLSYAKTAADQIRLNTQISDLEAQTQLSREREIAQRIEENDEARRESAAAMREEQAARMQASVDEAKRRSELVAIQGAKGVGLAEQDGTINLQARVQARLDNAAAADRELQAERELAEFRLQNATTESAQISAEQELRSIAHREKLNQIEQEKLARTDLLAAREQQVKREQALTKQITSFAQQQAQSIGQGLVGLSFARTQAARAAKASGESEEKAMRQATGSFLVGLGQQMAGLAISEGIQSIVAFASGNIPGGIAHAGAAAAAGVAAGVLTNRGNAMLDSVASSPDAGAKTGGSAPAVSSGGSGSPSEIPTSRRSRDIDERPPASKQNGQSVQNVYNIYSLETSEDIARRIRESQRQLAIKETG